MGKKFLREHSCLPTIFIIGVFLLVTAIDVGAKDCPSFFLKTTDGKIINPISGENAGEPYSTRQTCGSCHDYDRISKGYHFQMGWDELTDEYKDESPWRFSPGMMGGF